MIVTITMNPSMDFAYFIDHLEIGQSNRFATPVKSIGGKGINAGRSAALSGSKVALTGFVAGDTGKLVLKQLEKEAIFELDLEEIAGETRHAITIMHDGGTQTELIESGPEISDLRAFDLLAKIKLRHQQTPIDLICIAGSVNTSNRQLYLKMLDYICEEIDEKIPVFIDTSGEQLQSLLQESTRKPSFIKPNLYELGELLDKKITTKEEVQKELTRDCFKGINYILVSCGSEGALCKVGEAFYDIRIPKIPIRNTTGSGDASVGGFLHALSEGKPLEEILKYSMACGMSNAQHGEVGVICRKDVASFMQEIQVIKLESV